MKKLTILLAGTAGYVLGARAGRERYEQIKQQSSKAWSSPTVQGAVDDVQSYARQTGSDLGSAVGSKVAETASDVKDKVVSSVSGDGSDHEQPSTIGPGQGTA